MPARVQSEERFNKQLYKSKHCLNLADLKKAAKVNHPALAGYLRLRRVFVPRFNNSRG